MLMGSHEIDFVVAKEDAIPECRKIWTDAGSFDQDTIDIVAVFASEADRSYRSLGHVGAAAASRHSFDVRVGDIAANGLMRNANRLKVQDVVLRSIMRRAQKESNVRISDAQPRPFLFNGRGITHKDDSVSLPVAEVVTYTIVNQEGTVFYDQPFWYPFAFLERVNKNRQTDINFLSGIFMHAQAMPERAVSLRDNVMYRTVANRDVHHFPRTNTALPTQRLFVRDNVYPVKATR